VLQVLVLALSPASPVLMAGAVWGLPANTGAAGAMHRVGFFAAVRHLDESAPTGTALGMK
jgi:hypothetical protein